MKQKDLALVIVIVFVSAVISLIVSKSLFASPRNRQQAVEVVDPIKSDFPEPDSRYFNTQSIDPTKLIKIGDNTNPTPFNSKQ